LLFLSKSGEMPLDEAHDQWHGGELTMPATMSVQSKTIDEILASFTAGPNPKLPGTVLVAVDASGSLRVIFLLFHTTDSKEFVRQDLVQRT
jgi:hypothetical protein